MSADHRAASQASLTLELAEPFPPEVPVGSGVLLGVRVLGAACDLRGGRIEVMAGEDVIASAGLAASGNDVGATATLTLRAPGTVGAFTWDVRFPPQEIDGVAYGESVLPVSSRTRPHRTSLAVWAVPSPVPMGDRFAVMVGAKSSGACVLNGARVEIRDDTGAVAGNGTLGDTPWPGTEALYWTEIALDGPRREGPLCWTAAFAAAGLALPHVDASAEFSFTAVRPPEHRVAVTVTEGGAETPVEETQVALGPWRAATDKTGTAHLDVPAGTYDLAVWKSGFDAASRMVEITADASVAFELTRLPEELTAWD
jgi:hypothetical protein